MQRRRETVKEDRKPIRWQLDDNGVAKLMMRDSDHNNLFTDSFIDTFLSALTEIEEQRPSCLLITGLPDVFSGGADKQTLLDLCDGKIVVKDLEISERLVSAPFPIVSAMQGHAVGGGLVIGLCSDVMVLARESRYGAVFMNLGFTPGMGTTELLPMAFGPYIASEMMLGGRMFRGSELADRGVPVNAIVSKNDVYRRAQRIALQIADKPVDSIYLLKYTLSSEKRKRLIDARRNEDLMHRITFAMPETRRRISEHYND